MKKSELQKLRDKNATDLVKNIQVDKDNLWQLRLDLASGKTKNINEIRRLKNEIAVINTLIQEKELKSRPEAPRLRTGMDQPRAEK